MSSGKGTGVLAEPIERTFTEGDLSSLSLGHAQERYTSTDFDTFASIHAELECMNSEEVISTEEDPAVPMVEEEEEVVEEEEQVQLEQEQEQQEEHMATDSIEMKPDVTQPDVEMVDATVKVTQPERIIYTAPAQINQNIRFQTKPSLQRVPITAVQVKPKVAQAPQSQSIMIVSPAGGQGASQILKISHPASASAGQLQSLAQTLMTAKSADGNIVQLRTAQSGKPLMSTGQTGLTLGNLQAVKTVQSVKRPAQSPQTARNVFTKMILSGNSPHTSSDVIIAATSQSESPVQSQTIKFLTTTTGNQAVPSPTKTITFAQAQQMGLISSKMPHILPSTPQKQQGIIVNKLIQSSSTQPPKLTLIPTSTAKSPTKILPAPTITGQIRPSNSQASFSTAGKATIQQNPQKIIIRPGALKPGNVLGSQVIRIPSNQNIVAGANQLHQLQMPGRQVQYLRLVSTSSSGTSNVVSVGKPKTQGTLQAVGMTPKIAGQQQIVKVVPLNTGNQQLRSVAPKTSLGTGGQRLLIPASGGMNQSKNTLAIPASALTQLASGQAVLSTGTNVGNIVVLPAQYIQQGAEDSKGGKQPLTPSLLSSSQSSQGSSGTLSVNSIPETKASTPRAYNAANEPNGVRPRKPCNCTKSQCLKLYCDCFANGEFCHMCNCNNCSNNLGNEEERHRAIKSCLERNPNAFRPKIGKGRDTGDDIRRHNKGCNCKRSGCLKNYCECYEAKIPCSGNCKCIGCRNVEETALDKKTLKDLAETSVEVRTTPLNMNKGRVHQMSEMSFRPQATSNTGARQTFNFLTDKVVEITCQCLLAQAEEADRNMLDEDTSQRLIIEEFGRCLKEIIESAHKAEAT